ncbi:uncharacterized protein LOC111381061 [Olea europaea var. sylvestris]|uniref:uncharacterized protein LOC111381061 n=1 Tax=Olea europaea var. sylvestris TaxID=158386 RepID=UPI000C1D8319|nr:uncharacterized protein LOC111381061 [Olea europaea var. sylvestris]
MRRLDDANQSYVPAGIIGDMEREFGVRITYNKAWRAKEKGLPFLRSTLEESFQKLSSYCHMLTEKIPGTIAHIELDSNNRFLYFFLAFGPSGQYKGTLLVDAAQNANLQIYSLAWSVVNGETNASWYWFFAKLKDVVDDSNQLVFVSDRKKSIKRAITRLFPLSHHGACIWHIEKNLIARYSSSNVIFLFKRAAVAYHVSEFDQFMTQIRTIRPSMASYLERIGISTWSRAHLLVAHVHVESFRCDKFHVHMHPELLAQKKNHCMICAPLTTPQNIGELRTTKFFTPLATQCGNGHKSNP